ncbi:MAG: AAA family ATPase [Bacteroidales bacterium]|jgi:DNA repair exonuclease SbcCD ATPase subunit|nr:AAA family ATPase [Bacteroidales bacterium]
MSIKTICHIADIHIRKTPTRNDEYQEVFDRTIASLKEQKPDRIVVVGDLVHDYLDLQGEQLIMANNFLKELAKIAPVRITRGNHDCRKKNLKRVDSIKAIVETLGDYDVIYYDKTGFHIDENVAWAVWHHGQPKNNPWKTKMGKEVLANKTKGDMTTIDLFHDPITGCMSTTDFEMKSKSYYKISDFKGDLSLFGDIHKMQYLDKKESKAYCGSLIAQDISEGDDAFHGYLLWDVENREATPVSIHNDYSFHNIKITPYTDFEDLDFEVDDPTKYMKIRFVWGTLPQTRNKENERSVIDYIKSKYKNITISHKNNFIENEEIEINETINLENVSDDAVQQEIFKEFLEKIGTDKDLINDVLALDEEILKEIKIPDDQSIEWNIIKFGGKNFMSYEDLDIDWRKLDGLFQITGGNTAGKTTIMKIITYILFGKTLETENRIKFGDKRFVNNRNGANFCSGYLVVEANGEYFGIKKKTEINKNRSGDITGVPTSLSYYILASPDDEMNDESAIEKLDEDRRIKTQKQLESIIGSYNNFMRIVMTTSDTLNRILSNDMAIFIDSLLYDSGLDVFDKKLAGLKDYQKRINEKPKISCNVEAVTNQNTTSTQNIKTLEVEINEIEKVRLPDIRTRISKGRDYVETLTKKLYQIDPEIYNLDVDITREDISNNQKNIVEIKARKMVLNQSIDSLSESYDENRLNELIKKRDSHKQLEYDKKLEIKTQEREKVDYQHKIEIINGKIFTLKKEGTQKRDEIKRLKESKTCPTCSQIIDKKEHQDHIVKMVNVKEVEMFDVAKSIKKHSEDILKSWQPLIDKCDKDITEINEGIVQLGLNMEDILTEIGTLTNEQNDVNKRKQLQSEFDLIPTRIQNEELKIGILNEKITRHENSLKQIEENKRIEKGITAAKEKVETLMIDENDAKEDIFIRKTSIGEKQIKIKENKLLITEFKIQEHQNNVMALYKKCVHRDGIPRQMLSNYIIPKINLTLENILSVAPFKVWLDTDDLRPKLIYNDRPDSVIDCISASGKERTFSSVVLKFALNQINVKAKPTIFLLDEVMGKLDENSVEEFIEILQLIKQKMKKVLIIEHTVNLDPDYLIDVELDDKGISSLNIV